MRVNGSDVSRFRRPAWAQKLIDEQRAADEELLATIDADDDGGDDDGDGGNGENAPITYIATRKPFRRRVPATANTRHTTTPTTKKNAQPFLFKWQRAICCPESPLPSTTRFVLMVLSLNMDKDGGNVWTSQDRIALDSGLSLRAVKLHLRSAVKKGWIRRYERRDRRGGFAGYRYHANLPNGGGNHVARQPRTRATSGP